MSLTRQELIDYGKLRKIWRGNNILYAQQRLGLNPTRQQKQLLRAVQPNGSQTSVRAGHGVGKTTAVATAILWHLECFEFCKIPCTAPTASQLYNVLWAELAKWHRMSDEQSKKNGLPPELYLTNLFNKTQDSLHDAGAPSEWYAVARTARKEAPDALQGFHATDLLITEDDKAIERSEAGGSIFFVIEEASGVPDVIFEVAEGALSSSRSRLLMVGNPTKNSGFFARSHKQDRSFYNALHFNCADSPLTSETYRSNLVRKYGEDSNVVRVRADGEFPKQDDDVLIPLESAESAIERPGLADNLPRKLGIDVARFGDDRTVFILRQGRFIRHIEVRSRQDTMTTAGMGMKFWKEWDADEIYVDVIGIGAGVVDRLAELKAPVTAVNVAEKAPDRDKGVGNVEGQGAKLRDYLWLEMADWFRDDEPSFGDAPRDYAEDLAGEVCTVTYKIDSSGRVVVESKDDMKKRGLRSPDLADALGLTFANAGGVRISPEVMLAAASMGRRRY